MDGWITIGTELSTNKFDRQITELEKKIAKEEEKKLVIEAKLGQQEQELERARKKVDELAEAYQRLNELKQKQASGKATYSEFVEMGDITSAYGSLEQIETSFNKALDKQVQLEQKVEQTKMQYNDINAKVDKYKSKIESINVKKQQSDFQQIKNSIGDVGKKLSTSVKHIGRMIIGIFGIRSAFMFLRSMSSQLAQYDKQYAANLEYIKFALTQAIAPVLQWIVSLASQLLSIINAIVNALFGVNIFSKASANDFKKMKASAGGTAKAAKQIAKELAGFDEMNVLQDNKTSGGGGGGAGTPAFDLSKLQGETPEWLKWIADNRELILGFLAGLLTYLLLIELGIKAITALGIGLMVWGIVTAVMSLIEYLNDPSWENFGKIIQGIGIFIIGLGVAFLGLPAIVLGVAVLILGTIIKYWDKIKAFLTKGIEWLEGKGDWVRTMFGDVAGDMYDTFVKNIKLVLNYFDGMFTAIKGIFDGIIKFVKGVFTGDWKMAWEGIKQIFTNIWKAMKTTFTTVFEFIKNHVVLVAKTTGNILAMVFKAVVNAVLGVIEGFLNTPINAVNGLIDVINTLPNVNMPRLNTFNLPRLAKGGILNAPGRGTLVGSAIAGERGAEGVIPLTDTQAMETLGEAIGRYITINANIVNSMNGRVISRELRKVQNEQDFAFNS